MFKYSHSIADEWKLTKEEIIVELVFGFIGGMILGATFLYALVQTT